MRQHVIPACLVLVSSFQLGSLARGLAEDNSKAAGQSTVVVEPSIRVALQDKSKPDAKEPAAQSTEKSKEKTGDKTDNTQPAASKALTRQELEQEFEKVMSGSVLVGRFTVVGRENQAPKEEKYTITKVKKQDDGDWIFLSRIQYGSHDVQVPIKLQVEWAGDTPVITLTDLTIPGLGTFTSRVLVYRGWYAGTWQHGEVGGHLFGRIERLTEEKKDQSKDSKPADSKKSDSKSGDLKKADPLKKDDKN